MTTDSLRHRDVAVAVLFVPMQGFLLWNNPKWRGYAFPMKHFAAADPAQNPVNLALAALGESYSPLSLPDVTARPLDFLGGCFRSETAGEPTYYDYYAIEIVPGPRFNPAQLHPDLRFFSFGDLLAAPNVTEPTKEIARSLVTMQDASLLVVSRRGAAEREFLLVHRPGYGYFFPASRMKTDASAEATAGAALVEDTTFDPASVDGVKVSRHSETADKHHSARFGAGERTYRWQICGTQFPPTFDLNDSANPFALALARNHAQRSAAGQVAGPRGFTGWFTQSELETHPDVSPTMKEVRMAAIQAAERFSPF